MGGCQALAELEFRCCKDAGGPSQGRGPTCKAHVWRMRRRRERKAAKMGVRGMVLQFCALPVPRMWKNFSVIHVFGDGFGPGVRK